MAVADGGGHLPGRVRAIHDVPAAAVSNAAADNGAGFCYNIGRIAAAAGTVFFGTFSTAGDYRMALLYASFLFLPAAAFALMLPELRQARERPSR